MSRSPAQVMTALLRNSVPLSTLLRRRSNSDYADPWVMPTPPRISLPRKGSGVGQVGITQPLGLSGQIRNFVGGSGPGGGVAEVEAAGGVQGVFGGAGEGAGGQDRILVAVFAGQVDREAPAGG